MESRSYFFRGYLKLICVIQKFKKLEFLLFLDSEILRNSRKCNKTENLQTNPTKSDSE